MQTTVLSLIATLKLIFLLKKLVQHILNIYIIEKLVIPLHVDKLDYMQYSLFYIVFISVLYSNTVIYVCQDFFQYLIQ